MTDDEHIEVNRRKEMVYQTVKSLCSFIYTGLSDEAATILQAQLQESVRFWRNNEATDSRDLFERLFKKPKGVIRNGDYYSTLGQPDENYKRFITAWEAWRLGKVTK